MSLLVGRFDSFMTFSEYLSLKESIRPKETNYGLNPPHFNDHQIKRDISGIYGTCIVYEDNLYIIQCNKNTNEIGFGVSNTIPQTEEEMTSLMASDKRKEIGFALYAFNYVFYVVLEMIDYLSLNEIKFSAANKELNSVYTKLITNKFFNEELKSIGFSSLEFDGEYYSSKRI